jgi:hypothetical protein
MNSRIDDYFVVMRIAAFLLLIGIGSVVSAQRYARYDALVQQADSLYGAEDYLGSAQRYSAAFGSVGEGGTVDDMYSAACSWARADVPDSAFRWLFLITEKLDFGELYQVTTDSDLTALHADDRWQHLVALVAANKDKIEVNFNRPIAHTLDSILRQDQLYRKGLGRQIQKQYGQDSEEWKAALRAMDKIDSSNLIAVTKILDEHGWLGPDSVGDAGSIALFAVIQHADHATQERYLPMMRAAVAKGDAEAGDLAYVEDRAALEEGKRQIYGSQIDRNQATGKYYVSPLEDPDHVDERRAAVGLGPLADYVANWDIIWDVGAYKADLPALEARERARK